MGRAGQSSPPKLVCTDIPTDVDEGMEVVGDSRDSLDRIVSLFIEAGKSLDTAYRTNYHGV